ncbi:MAG TPA: hypothetical protein VKA70_04725 [Blastocatellia bacterium]|nr:hypothetical protein [Blastocatellia bacterium]
MVFLYWVSLLPGEPNLTYTLFNLDGEANIPAWFSSSQLLLICLMVWVAALLGRSSDRPRRFSLLMMGALFLLLSLDETSQVHEGVTASLGDRYVDWVPPLMLKHIEIPVVSLVLLLLLVRLVYPDLKAFWLWSRRKTLIAAAGILTYLSGASLLETMGYEFIEKGTPLYRIEVCAEEFLEMLGASLILYTAISLVEERLKLGRREYLYRKSAT